MGILDRLEVAPRAETTTLRSPATWFLEALGYSRDSASGVRVSEATALKLSPYYCGVNMISGTCASLPANVYKREGRKRDVYDRHPAHWLLHNEPNPEMTAMSYRQTSVMHAIARGNAYSEIVWNIRNEPIELWPLLPHLTKPVRDDVDRLWYEVKLPDTMEPRYLMPENVLHVPGLGYDGVMGYGLIQVACESIGLSTAQEQYSAKFFKNGGSVSGTLETANVLTDPQFTRLKKEVVEKLQGLTNAHRIAILEHGLSYKATNPNHRDAQLVEAKRFSVEEWARWLNMPPHKLKEMTHATFSNIEHQNIEWVVDTIRPWLIRFEQEWNRKLFRKQSVFYTKHVVDGLLRGDQKSRFEAYAIGRNWGWMSANDVCELEDRNPLPGKQGDMYLVPANMVPAEKAGEQLEPKRREAHAQPTPAADLHRRVAAERVVIFGERTDRTAVAAKAQEWLGCSKKTAEDFVELSLHLDLLAEEANIDAEELRGRKVDTLVRLVMEEAHA